MTPYWAEHVSLRDGACGSTSSRPEVTGSLLFLELRIWAGTGRAAVSSPLTSLPPSRSGLAAAHEGLQAWARGTALPPPLASGSFWALDQRQLPSTRGGVPLYFVRDLNVSPQDPEARGREPSKLAQKQKHLPPLREKKGGRRKTAGGQLSGAGLPAAH